MISPSSTSKPFILLGVSYSPVLAMDIKGLNSFTKYPLIFQFIFKFMYTLLV